MFIHLGGEVVVYSSDVIVILDANKQESSKITQQFLLHAKEMDRIVCDSVEETKSYVVTRDKVYCSPISSLTLNRRSHFVSSLESR